MTAQVILPKDFLWKLVERDIDAFFKGERDMQSANIGRALGFGLPEEIEPIKDCWAEARKLRAERQRHQEGA